MIIVIAFCGTKRSLRWPTPVLRDEQAPTATTLSLFNLVSSVGILGRLIRPYAVFWLIVSIVIDAFKGKPVRSLPHVRVKQFKPVPSLAYSYSSASIVIVRWMIRTLASRLHVLPAMVFGGLMHAVGFAGSQHNFGRKTAARFSLSALKPRRSWCRCVPTFTKTLPRDVPAAISSRFPHDGQATKNTASKINGFHSAHNDFPVRFIGPNEDNTIIDIEATMASQKARSWQ